MDPWWNVSKKNPKIHDSNKEHRVSKASIGQPISISSASTDAFSSDNIRCPALTMKCIILQNNNGFGLTVSGDKPVYVQTVKEDGAAHRAGVHEGDRIIKVNGTNVTDFGHIKVVKLIKAGGSYVALTLLGVPGDTNQSQGSEATTSHNSSEHNKHNSNKPFSQNPFYDQKVDTIKKMLEQARQDYERIKDEYAKLPSDKLLQDLRASQNMMQDLEKKLWKANTIISSPPTRSSRFITDIDESLGLEEASELRTKRGISSSAMDLRSPDLDLISVQHRSSGESRSNGNNRGSCDSMLIQMESSSHSSDAISSTLSEAGKNTITSNMVPVQNTNIINFEDDDMVDDCDADHGPFNDLERLKQRPAHFAVFLNYVLLTHEPNNLLFLIAVDSYKQISSTKDLHKQADILFKNFLSSSACFKVDVDESICKSIHPVIRSKSPSEDTLRVIFDTAVQLCTKEIRDQLSQYRTKREQGLGHMYGDEKLPQGFSGFDSNLEAKLVDDIIGTKEVELQQPNSSFDINTSSSSHERLSVLQEILHGFVSMYGTKRSKAKFERVFSILRPPKSTQARPRSSITNEPVLLDRKGKGFIKIKKPKDGDMTNLTAVGTSTLNPSASVGANNNRSNSNNDLESLLGDSRKPSRTGSVRGRRPDDKRSGPYKSHSDPDKDKVEQAVSQHSIALDGIDQLESFKKHQSHPRTVPSFDDDPELTLAGQNEHWCDSVSKEFRNKMSKSEINRQEIINELLYTEQHHIRDLRILECVFYEQLKSEKLLDDEELNTIFGNLEHLLPLHRQLNSSLQSIKERDGHVVKEISDALLELFGGDDTSNFMVQCAQFCINQTNALAFIKDRCRKDQKFNDFLAEQQRQPLCRKLHLKDFIPMEFQRLTKYPLLFENIKKYTRDKKSEEYKKIGLCCEKARGILAYVNKQVKIAEDREQMREIQQNLDRSPLQKLQHHDTIMEFKDIDLTAHEVVYHGPLSFLIGMADRRKEIGIYMIVYEHVAVLLEISNGKYILKTHGYTAQKVLIVPFIRLDEIIVRPVATDKKSFFIMSAHDGLFQFITQTVKSKSMWIGVIEKCISGKANRKKAVLPKEEKLLRRSVNIKTIKHDDKDAVKTETSNFEPEAVDEVDAFEDQVQVDEVVGPIDTLSSEICEEEATSSNLPDYRESIKRLEAEEKLRSKQEKITELLKEKRHLLAEIANTEIGNLETVMEVSTSDQDVDSKTLILHSIFCVDKLSAILNSSSRPDNIFPLPIREKRRDSCLATRLSPFNANHQASTTVAATSSTGLDVDETSEATTGYNSESIPTTSEQRWAVPVDYLSDNMALTRELATPDEVADLQTPEYAARTMSPIPDEARLMSDPVDNSLYERLTNKKSESARVEEDRTPGPISPNPHCNSGSSLVDSSITTSRPVSADAADLMVGTGLIPFDEMVELVTSLQTQLTRLLRKSEEDEDMRLRPDTIQLNGDEPPPSYEQLQAVNEGLDLDSNDVIFSPTLSAVTSSTQRSTEDSSTPSTSSSIVNPVQRSPSSGGPTAF